MFKLKEAEDLWQPNAMLENPKAGLHQTSVSQKSDQPNEKATVEGDKIHEEFIQLNSKKADSLI